MLYVSSLLFLLQAVTASRADEAADVPDPTDHALMARYIVHNSNWTSVSYISNDTETKGLPLAALFSVSDGPKGNGSGIPYFYVSRLQEAVTNLMDSNNNCSLMMSLAQTPICDRKHLDPEDPRCAHTILTGTFQPISNGSAEFESAKASVFSRHPTFESLPESHHFFFAKLNITRITVQDTFGGPSVVTVPDYFQVQNGFLQLFRTASPSNSNRNNILVFCLLLFLSCLLL